MQAKDDYWGGPVCIETLRFIALPNPDTAWDAFRQGETQVVYMSDPTLVAEAQDAGIQGAELLDCRLDRHAYSPWIPIRVRGSTTMYRMSTTKFAIRTPMMMNRNAPWSRK